MAHETPAPWAVHPFEVALGGPEADVDGAWELARNLGVEATVEVSGPRPHPLTALGNLELDALVVLGQPRRSLPWVACQGDQPWVPTTAGPGLPLAVVGSASLRSTLPDGVALVATLAEAARLVRAHWDATTTQRPVFGLVLAGGQSQRMGQDKASLAYHGEPEALRTYRLLERFCDRVFVSCREDQADLVGRRGLPQIHDSVAGKGPVSGLLSAFEAHPGAAWLAVACDLPRLDEDTLAALVAGRNPFRFATAFRGYQDLAEPLCTLWEPKARARLYQFLGAGFDCPRKVLINSPIALLDLPKAGALTNANTPEERQEVLDDLDR